MNSRGKRQFRFAAGTAVSLMLFLSTTAEAAPCVPSETIACLKENRFEVSMSFDADNALFVPASAAASSGLASAALYVPPAPDSDSDDTALMSWYDSEQRDAVVRVLDGCPINNRFWVFAAAATDAATALTVTDSVSGEIVQYVSQAGTPFVPILDTTAFETCGSVAPTSDKENGIPSIKNAIAAGKGVAACGSTFCLQGNRFALDITANANRGTGDQQIANAGSFDHTAIGWEFRADSLSTLTSVLDGRADNGAFWFLASSLTQSSLEYSLTDLSSGLTNTYVEPFGESSTIADRGQPITVEFTDGGGSKAAAGTAGFVLRLTNTAPTERGFSVTVPVPESVTSASYRCAATGSATCPAKKGLGPLDVDGIIAAGGGLSFSYTLNVASPEASPESVQLTASVRTAAHALAPESVSETSATATISRALPVPLNAIWMKWLMVAALAFFAMASLSSSRRIASGD